MQKLHTCARILPLNRGVINTRENMTKIYFIYGFVGSGKTTYSKMLELKYNAFRFNADEWMIPLFGEHQERKLFDSRINSLKALFKESAIKMINLGLPVIFDFGFWKEIERKNIAEWATEQNIDFEFIYLDVTYSECCKRAAKRNDFLENKSYEMTPEMLELFWSWFEVPNQTENITWVVN